MSIIAGCAVTPAPNAGSAHAIMHHLPPQQNPITPCFLSPRPTLKQKPRLYKQRHWFDACMNWYSVQYKLTNLLEMLLYSFNVGRCGSIDTCKKSLEFFFVLGREFLKCPWIATEHIWHHDIISMLGNSIGKLPDLVMPQSYLWNVEKS